MLIDGHNLAKLKHIKGNFLTGNVYCTSDKLSVSRCRASYIWYLYFLLCYFILSWLVLALSLHDIWWALFDLLLGLGSWRNQNNFRELLNCISWFLNNCTRWSLNTELLDKFHYLKFRNYHLLLDNVARDPAHFM